MAWYYGHPCTSSSLHYRKCSQKWSFPIQVILFSGNCQPLLPQLIIVEEMYPCYCRSENPSLETVICKNPDCAKGVFHKKCTGTKVFRSDWRCIPCKTEEAKVRREQATEKKRAEKENQTENTNKKKKNKFSSPCVLWRLSVSDVV